MSTIRFTGPQLVHRVAALGLAVGLGYWLPRLFAPATAIPVAAFHTEQANTTDTEQIAAWFGGRALKAHVDIMGLLASSSQQGAALLSVNGEPPRAYRTGDVLATGVILHSISARGIVLEHDGTYENIPMKSLPHQEYNGFVSVPATADEP